VPKMADSIDIYNDGEVSARIDHDIDGSLDLNLDISRKTKK
jgi:hypothetical protein